MKIKMWLLLIPTAIGFRAAAQNDADYLRYSMLQYGSTARSLSMGNSFSALGADFSTLSINPAGIGLYRRGEFSISPAFSNRNAEQEMGGSTLDDNHFKFSFGNFGFVFSSKQKKGSNWKRLNFGFGYNRTNNFSTNEFSQYDNARNTLIDSYVETLNTNGIAPEDISFYNPYDIDLAWQTFLIDTFAGDYDTAIPFAGVRQQKITERRGGQGEWAFSVGGNYDDRLYVGATMGIPVIRYEEETTWSEEDIKDTIPFFDNYRYNTILRTSGSGINFKIGAIYQLADFMRLGVAIHTPTWMILTDDYQADVRTNLEDGQIRDFTGPDFIPFEYRVNSPFRVISSIAIIAGKSAAINMEYEFLDFSQGKIKPRDSQFAADFSETNRSIQAKYGMQHNVRAGIEIPYDQLRFRFGGEYSTSPFDENFRPNDTDIDLSRYSLTGGIGYRTEKYYLDAAYAWSRSGNFNYAYRMDSEPTPGIRTLLTDNRIQFTFGWLF